VYNIPRDVMKISQPVVVDTCLVNLKTSPATSADNEREKASFESYKILERKMFPIFRFPRVEDTFAICQNNF